jgi:hypothetical protein
MTQTTTFTVEFQVEHVPDSEPHLRYIAERYLESKGVIIRDGKIVI